MKEVIIKNDREKESLTEFTKKIFDEVSAYNDAHPETGFLLTAGDGRGGVSFVVGDTIPVIRSFVESSIQQKNIAALMWRIINAFSRIKFSN